MRYFPDVLGNVALRERMGQLIVAQKLPHAIILEGPTGTGKRFFAKRLAAALLCANRENPHRPLPCMSCSACRKVMEGNATDVVYVNRGDKASIGVDPIREIRSDMFLSATEGEKKVYIIEDAHTMTTAAQNALLIVLEEPPPNVQIILTTESREAMLTTIRSRAQLSRMGLLSHEELERFGESQPAVAQLKRQQPEAYQEAKQACLGCAGEFLRLANRSEVSALLARRETVFRLLNALAEREGVGTVLDCVKSMSGKRKDLPGDLQALLLALRDLLLMGKDENAPLLFYTNREYAQAHSAALGGRRVQAMYDIVMDTVNSVEHNVNMNLILSGLATRLMIG